MSFEKRTDDEIKKFYEESCDFHKLGEGEDWKLVKIVQLAEEDEDLRIFNIWYLFDLPFGKFEFYLFYTESDCARFATSKNKEGEIVKGIEVEFNSCTLIVYEDGLMKLCDGDVNASFKIPVEMANSYIGDNGIGTTAR